jgi:hypothetical protein
MRTLIGVSVMAAAIAGGTSVLLQGQGPSPTQQGQLNPPIAHTSNQSVSPSFEGWYNNPDGSISMSFGYMNRNYVEEPDIPVGPNNHFSPGPEDQGQPTHFLPRRQWGVFAIKLPKEAARDKNFKLTWTITANGQTIAVPGHLRPEWEIDALREATVGNTPPVIRFRQNGPTGQGPLGAFDEMTVAFPGPATLTVFATDDGVKKREQLERPSGTPALGVGWSRYRGPGEVKFNPADPKIEGGKATTTATFSEPGEYVLRVHAWDDSGRYAGGFQCCWTNGHVKVTVTGAKTQSR